MHVTSKIMKIISFSHIFFYKDAVHVSMTETPSPKLWKMELNVHYLKQYPVSGQIALSAATKA